jgi:hypothetical protein
MSRIVNFWFAAIIAIFILSSTVFGAYTWVEKKINDTGETAGNAFGSAVAIEGSYAVIGAQNANSSKGAAYIFQRVSGVWTKVRTLTASDGASGDCFGCSVAISGNNILVGAKGFNSNRGAAYMYKINDAAWNQKLTISTLTAQSLFGSAVSISGSYAAIGTPTRATVYVYYISDSTSTWTLLTTLTGTSGSKFGDSVSMNGDYLLVGAPDYTNGVKCGGAFIYERNGGTYSNTTYATLSATDKAAGDKFGCSVSINGNYAIIGACYGGSASVECGSVYRFGPPDSWHNWGSSTEIIPSDGTAGDLFGRSVAISSNYMIVGAPGNGNGACYIYTVGSWTSPQKLTAAVNSTDDYFGGSVSTNGTYVLCGDVNDDDYGVNSGSAYVYEYTEIGTLTLLSPNGGENIAGKSTSDITWSSTGPVSSVALEYSKDNAATWTSIGTSANTGTYEWTVPDVNSTKCYVRVKDAAAPTVLDASNAAFTIYHCTLLYDSNNDCVVDFIDFAEFSYEWLKCGNPADANCVR